LHVPRSRWRRARQGRTEPGTSRTLEAIDPKAESAIESTARYLGLGLAGVVNTFDPVCVYIGGEITRAWDLIEPTVRSALAERALTAAAAATDIRPVTATEYPRLRGAAALVVAPAYAVRGVA
jgi:predicted NBD/HSP70 family sugar kinase